jgi:hypothetical protein
MHNSERDNASHVEIVALVGGNRRVEATLRHLDLVCASSQAMVSTIITPTVVHAMPL